mmetsp:Transcript_12923/g.15442  ORF Transcript_12923/g.15442 Transcript_12923/m.15442 type:complete len:102 (-) Transcript_12923:2663-2968(-)
MIDLEVDRRRVINHKSHRVMYICNIAPSIGLLQDRHYNSARETPSPRPSLSATFLFFGLFFAARAASFLCLMTLADLDLVGEGSSVSIATAVGSGVVATGP